MIFEKIRYKNLLSTGNQWTEIELNRNKTTLIVGANGSGKSTILDAICFALFNKPFRPDFNKPQLVNSINGKGLVVEVEMGLSRKRYKFVRGIKPAIFEVYEDDRLINQDANVRDYQDYVEKNILKTNYRTFCQIVILGSANYTPFMKLTAQSRREVVEDILDLKIFSIMNSILLTKKQQNEYAINDILTEKKLLTQRIELIKQHTEEITSTNTKLIEDKKDRIASAKSDIERADDDIAQLNLNISDIRKLISDADKKVNAQQELRDIKIKLETKISNLSKGIDFFHDNENCPTCSQVIDPDFKCNIIIKKKLVMDEAADALIQVNDKLENINERLEQIKKNQIEINNLLIEKSRRENTIEQLKKYITELENEISMVAEHNKKVDKSEVVKLNEQLADINIKYSGLVNRKNTLELAGILLKDSGIKSKIIKQYIPIINKLINKYLSMLDFFVQFEINERFDETIKSRHRDEFTYGSFSEGEKFRINLAILFTWRAVAKLRNSVNTNILFLDEVFDSSLDVSGTEEFLKIINQTEAMNIFIISHKTDQLYDKFEHVIKFEKNKNFSRMVTI